MGAVPLKGLLEKRDQELAALLCGPRYGPSSERYERAGTRRRTLATRLGKIQVRVSAIRDRVANRTYMPLWREILIRRGVYQEDVIGLCVDAVQRMTYRNPLEELGKTIGCVPSPMSLNRYVVREGRGLNQEIRARELETQAALCDGTKLSRGNHQHHDVNVTLAVNPVGPARIRCLTVGEDWTRHANALKKTRFVDGDGRPSPAKVVTDLEKGLAGAVTPDQGFWSPCPCPWRVCVYQ